MNQRTANSVQSCLWGVVICMLVAAPARAVSIHVHSHAHDTSGVQTSVENDFGLFSASGNAPATVTGAHAHAWGNANVGFFSVRKRARGHGWFMDGNSPKHWWWHWRVGTGQFIVEGPPNTVADLQLILPDADKIQPEPMDPDEDPPIGPDPIQGLVADGFLGVGMDLDAGIQQQGKLQPLWTGSAFLGGPDSGEPGLKATGDLANAFRVVSGENPNAVPRNSALLEGELLSEVFRVRTNEPFELVMNLRSWSGAPPDDPVAEPPFVNLDDDREFGTASDLVWDMALLDRSGVFTLKPIPEPSSLVLALVGLALLAACRRGRSQRR